MRSGILIEIEGANGSGKSSLVDNMGAMIAKDCTYIHDMDFPHWRKCHEPGGTEIADTIRSILTKDDGRRISDHERLFLYCAAKASLFEQAIMPALNRGNVVIKDRGLLSVIAYQSTVGIGSLDPELCLDVACATSARSIPDVMVALVGPTDMLWDRTRARDAGTHMGYLVGRDSVDRINTAYTRAISWLQHRLNISIVCIDARLSTREMVDLVFDSIKPLLVGGSCQETHQSRSSPKL